MVNLEELETFFRGVYRNLKPGGKFVCLDENPNLVLGDSIAKYGITFKETEKKYLEPYKPIYRYQDGRE